MNIGNKIREQRVLKGYSQEYLANKLGISQNSIHKLESGKKIPNINEIYKFSEILEVPINELLDIPIKQDFKDCIQSGNNYCTINHNFPKEFIEILSEILNYLKKDK